MDGMNNQSPKKYYKSGTPLEEKPNPRAGIIKGSTTRMLRSKSPSLYDPVPIPDFLPLLNQDKPPLCSPQTCIKRQIQEDQTDPNGTRLIAGYNPNENEKIEKYLSSDVQNILVVKKVDAIAPIVNPAPLSSQLKQNKRNNDDNEQYDENEDENCDTIGEVTMQASSTNEEPTMQASKTNEGTDFDEDQEGRYGNRDEEQGAGD